MKTTLTIGVASALSLTAGAALAADGRYYNDGPRAVPKAPVVAIEARFGPYRPNVDRAFSGVSPYKDVFGERRRVMVGGEVDWQALHVPHFGSIGVGGIFGYTSASAKARFSDRPDVESGEETSFDLWMFSAVAVVRVDVLARETWIPLVVYGKLGPAVGLWSTSNGGGISRAPDGTAARGRTNGSFAAVGAMFLLDVLDRQAAKSFAVEQGVKHTYLFGEYTMANLYGLGQSGPVMQVGDRTWTLGFAFEL
jgi:hypothetical protein